MWLVFFTPFMYSLITSISRSITWNTTSYGKEQALPTKTSKLLKNFELSINIWHFWCNIIYLSWVDTTCPSEMEIMWWIFMTYVQDAIYFCHGFHTGPQYIWLGCQSYYVCHTTQPCIITESLRSHTVLPDRSLKSAFLDKWSGMMTREEFKIMYSLHGNFCAVLFFKSIWLRKFYKPESTYHWKLFSW